MFRFLYIALLLTVSDANAHPVSYEDGAAIMTRFSRAQRELSLVYSPKWWFGTGAIIEKLDEDRAYQSVHLGLLVNRWNLPEAQGNFYLYGGPGRYSFDESDEDGSFMRVGAQADYETRKFYIAASYTEYRSLKGDFTLLDDALNFGIGLAPYVANFKELNAWVIFRVRAVNRFEDFSYVPTLRFFYKNFLWEVGQSFKGESQLNFMIRY